jgi:phenylpropionate dioxygenase-like ring-hydroxylating dioxygenase large terminal subunit
MKVMKGWHAIAESRELQPEKPLGLRRFGEDWVLWRDAAGTPVAMQDRCPHRAAKLSLGAVTNGQIRCPYHGIAFDDRGFCTLVPELGRAAPALRTVAVPVQDVNGFLWVWVGGGVEPEGSPPWFGNLSPSFVYTRQHETWPIHYSRWVENELDITHLPFVHARTIGRGRDPQAQSHFDFNPVGIRILLDKDSAGTDAATIDFLYPNLWRLSISKRMHLVMAFVPIAEDCTKVYVRTYHNFARTPVLRALIEPFLRWFNDRVLAEDRRVVLSQRDPVSPSDRPEILFRQDTAIRHFRSLIPGFVDTSFIAAPTLSHYAQTEQAQA